MDWRDSDTERMVKDILDDEFDRKDVEVKAVGPRNQAGRQVWLSHGRQRVPLIPLNLDYRRVDEKHPPKLLVSLEDWRTSHTGDLPHILSNALNELRRRESNKTAVGK
jgi:hypothetical protein